MMNIAHSVLLLLLTGAAFDDSQEAQAEVRAALDSGNFPWYDAKEDAFKSVRMPKPEKPKKSEQTEIAFPTDSPGFVLASLGQWIVFLLLSGGLLLLIILMARYWQRWLESEELIPVSKGPAREAIRTGTLPTGLTTDEADPLAAARAARARGDFRKAIVLLFAHQLLTLDRLGLIHLAPGRTGRQLVRSLADVEIRGQVAPTLRLFEEVYYGQRDPSASTFEAVWTLAEAFEQSMARREKVATV